MFVGEVCPKYRGKRVIGDLFYSMTSLLEFERFQRLGRWVNERCAVADASMFRENCLGAEERPCTA